MRSLDRSARLARLLERTSSRLAKRRGLLPMLGVALVLVSFLVNLINLAQPSPALALLWSVTHHIGLLLALIGLLLIEPLGR